MKILIHILMDYDFIIQAFWIILPAYIANASALLLGGGIPIDFGLVERGAGETQVDAALAEALGLTY